MEGVRRSVCHCRQKGSLVCLSHLFIYARGERSTTILEEQERETTSCSSGKHHVGGELSTEPYIGNCAFGRVAGREARSVWQPESEVLRTTKL